MRNWVLGDIKLGGFWYLLRDKSGGAPETEIFRVVGICEQPTVTVENIVTGKRETHAVTSPNFARFAQLKRQWVDGSGD